MSSHLASALDDIFRISRRLVLINLISTSINLSSCISANENPVLQFCRRFRIKNLCASYDLKAWTCEHIGKEFGTIWIMRYSKDSEG